MSGLTKIGVLASGRGSNFRAIARACASGRCRGEVVILLSDNPDAGALKIAEEFGIPSRVFKRRDFATRDEFERAFVDELKGRGVEIICLAGFMRIIHKPFLEAFPGRILNIHPALLPAFPGLEAQRQAWEYGVKISGCTVHFVDAGVDTGPIILQAAVPVLDDDTPESLAARILEQEHKIYPQAIQWIAEGRVEIINRQVKVTGSETSTATLLNPSNPNH